MTPNGQTSAEGGATVDVAKADRGLVERPTPAPRLEFRIADAFGGLYGREVGRNRAGCGT